MKNKLYIIVVAILILIAGLLLTFYYLQNFDEDFDFISSINYDSLEIQRTQRGDVNYLGSVTGEIGTLSLKNDGFFSQVYEFPRLVGCIDTKSNINQQDLNIRNYQFQITFLNKGITAQPKQTIEIDVGDEKDYQLIGQYNSYDVPVYVFQDSVESLSIYELPKNNNNPLRDNSRYRKNYYGNDCNALKDNLKPLAEIPLS
jgi:hypothetical protein